MNLQSRRGLENRLLRRVRRHQSMTALFRAPVNRPSKFPSQPWATPVIQTQMQNIPMHRQAQPVDVIDSSVTSSSTPSPVVARQVVSPPAPVTIRSNPEKPRASPSTETTSSSDLTWKRLQTIFRKHQEQDAAQTTTNETMPVLESNIPDAPQPHSDEAPPNRVAERQGSEEHSSPIQDPTIQRSPENIGNQTQSAVTKIGRKHQTRPPLPVQTEPTPEAKFVPTQREDPSKEGMLEIADPESATDQLPLQAISLEAVWNVQRVEASHPLMDETGTRPEFVSPNRDEHEQKLDHEPVPSYEEHDHPAASETLHSPSPSDFTQEARKPVEILSPSRPRPSQGNAPSTSANIQRQIERNQATKEIIETPPVNTVIGPLPADLWWLLGEQPPSSEAAPKTNNNMAKNLNRKEAPQEQSNVFNPKISTENLVNATSMPNIIQRQTVADQPSVTNRQEEVHSPRVEKKTYAEPDLDDLARRVYAEVRRRLATEWERIR